MQNGGKPPPGADFGDLAAAPVEHEKPLQRIFVSRAGTAGKFTGLAANIKASFGVFVSDVVLSQVRPDGDSFEIALAALSAISLVWCVLGAAREVAASAHRSTHGGKSESVALVGTFVDVLELLESVGVVFVIRIALQYVQKSLTSIHSEAVYTVISLVLFFCFDAFGRIGSSSDAPYDDWGVFVSVVKRAVGPPDPAASSETRAAPMDTRWVPMVRPIASSISPI
jgi:hypothetical protein|tara:strand:- start:533 stop:1210 length:678 start_codon:yes stop_codon:yes gene_type:complete